MKIGNKHIFLGIKLNILGKLLIGIIFLIMLISLIALVGIRNISNLEKTYTEMMVLSNKNNTIHNIKLYFQQIVMPPNDYLIHGNKIELSNFEQLLKEIQQLIYEYSKLVGNKNEQILFDKIESSLIELTALSGNILEIEDPIGNIQGAIMMEEMDGFADSVVTEIEAFLTGDENEREENIKASHLTIIKTSRAIIIVGLLISFCLFTGGFFYVREITRPLKILEIAAQKVSEGDMFVKAEVNTNDEIDNLAKSFNSMIEVLEKTTVSRDYLNGILNRMIDTLIITDAEGKIKIVNKSALDLLGYQEGEIIGQHIGIVMSKEGNKNVQSDINDTKELFKNEHIDNIHNNYHTKAGTVIPVSFSSSLMYNSDNRISGLICIASHNSEFYQGEKEVAQVNSDTEYPFIRTLGEIPLTKRELEILRLITRDQSSNLEIANKLFISVRTVETHRKNIMKKLHTKSVISLVHYAAQNGII